MTCRQNLVLGLFVALSLSPAAAQLAHAASQSGQTAASPRSEVPEITLRRGSTSATAQPAAWKSSSFDAGADIRFKKPGLGASSSVAADPHSKATNPITSALKKSPLFTKPSQEQVVISDDAAQSAAPKTEQNRTVMHPGSPNSRFVAPQASGQTAALTQVAEVRPLATIAESAYTPVTQAIAAEQVERSNHEPPMSLAAKLNLQSAATAASEPTATNTARPQVRLTDEQLQLVSQILMDNQVMRAAQEEALPPAPGDANADRNGENGSKHDVPNLDGDPMYYGECCPPRPRLFWTAGVEATFLNPDLNTDGVSVDVEEIDENRHDICTTLSNDIDSIYVSPRIWLGVQGCAWGANLRYWHLQASEGAYDPSIGGLGTWNDYDCGVPDFGFTTCSRLEAYTIDLELTRRFCLNDCAMQAAMGIRHAEIDHDESLWALANADQGLLTGMARANRLSRGTGLQFGLYGRKPIFPCSCVHWFYNARWSALWGPTQTSVETFASVHTIADPNISGSAASVNGAYTNVDDTLFIGELQLGLEWDYCLQCIPANAFFRAALEYQRWDGGKGFSQSQSFAGAEIVGQVDPVSIITANAAASVPQMDLIGIALSTGLTW
jgi:hypothetical protein